MPTLDTARAVATGADLSCFDCTYSVAQAQALRVRPGCVCIVPAAALRCRCCYRFAPSFNCHDIFTFIFPLQLDSVAPASASGLPQNDLRH